MVWMARNCLADCKDSNRYKLNGKNENGKLEMNTMLKIIVSVGLNCLGYSLVVDVLAVSVQWP